MAASKKAASKRYVSVFFEKRMLDAIDDYRFKQRLPSRTEAIRRLIDYALKQKPKS